MIRSVAARDGLRRDAGLLADVLVSTVVSSLMAVAIFTTFVVQIRSAKDTTRHLSESNDVQLLSAALAADVNNLTELTSAGCGSTAGSTPLVQFEQADGSRAAYYVSGTAGTLERRTCAADGSRLTVRTLARQLSTTPPTATCDGAACVVGDSPSSVALRVTERSGYVYSVVGSRRYHPGGGTAGGLFIILGSGNSVVTASGGSLLDVNGDARINSVSPTWCNCGATNVSISGTTYQGPVVDPLASLPAPSGAGLPVYTNGVYQGPGVYRSVQLTVPASTLMAPGMYITEAGFRISSGPPVTANGVFIYNGCASDAPAGCTPGKFTISGSGGLVMSALASGPYAGIVLFHGRGNTNDVTLSGSAVGQAFGGIIYAPDADKFTMGSGGAALTVGGIIAKVVVTSGGGVITVGQP